VCVKSLLVFNVCRDAERHVGFFLAHFVECNDVCRVLDTIEQLIDLKI
jgi:hypothetical protein